MNNQALTTYQYSNNYDTSPKKEVKNGAVNIYINGVNTPQTPYAYPYSMPPCPYYYPYPYYLPANNINNNQQNNTSVATQNLNKNSTNQTNSSNKTEKTDKKDEKKLTEITPELLKGLNEGLLHGDKQIRMHSIARIINLLREDDPSRKTDPRFIDLINNALHPNQPDIVRETALSAVHNDAVKANDRTRQLVAQMTGKNDKTGLAKITASQLSPPGQRLNVISQ